ncbi:BNR/Asp-box repeat protein [Opitutaceae bacterium TAV1]|nr:BNR/Asp-box repeat protein [Opitutaceae bacterium TAV1]
MTNTTSPASLDRLRSVFAPQIVGIPPTNAIRELMLLPDGEIRHYGFRGSFARGTVRNIYLSSPDHGFSWVENDSPLLSPGATVRSPWSGDWLTLFCHEGGPVTLEEFHSIRANCPAPGLYLHRSAQGPDGPFATTRVGDLLPRMLTPRQPLPLRSRKRWLFPVHAATAAGGNGRQHAIVYLSDDDGATWRYVCLPVISGPGLVWPHEGLRWENCGAEPTIAELSDGRLHMLIRTAHDRYWESFSDDAGDTWTPPAPSRFYGTITTPLLFRLSNGRLLCFFNNTTPLPEPDHALQPGLGQDVIDGIWEDVFTNRDAIHAALSDDDGKTWRGFRELHLNDRRNDIDFRSRGGNDGSRDKSVHQSQAIELPYGKVLLAFGQHPESARLLLFDPDWLLETDRRDDFTLGLVDWSIHSYLKSRAGSVHGYAGHCSANRRPGPALIPHPGGEPSEVLQIARHPDPRLIEEKQGAVWNFPAAHAGRLVIHLRQPPGSAGTQIALVDRWFNPTDPVVARFSQFVLNLDSAGRINKCPSLTSGRWHRLTIEWNFRQTPPAVFRIDDGEKHPLSQIAPTLDGISYLHLQSAASTTDPHGILIRSVEKTALR